MFYTIRHVTRFTYDTPVSESVMEVRMRPRSDASQRCHHFALSTLPASRVMTYRDHDGNAVHHFGIPGPHTRLTLTAEALVECVPGPLLPDALPPETWDDLDALVRTGTYGDSLASSLFVQQTPLVDALASDLDLARGVDPLTTLHRIAKEVYARFEYKPRTTRVDSPIDEALEARQGVCQDFAHIMAALVRRLGVPCRYVSGYLFHGADAHDRSADGASHAWVEALMPGLGWVGFDPTNDLVAGERHIRVAVGRDYADVPPTRGVYKGTSAVKSELAVAVRVGSAVAATGDDLVPWMSQEAGGRFGAGDIGSQQ